MEDPQYNLDKVCQRMKSVICLLLVSALITARADGPSDKKMNSTNKTELATFGGDIEDLVPDEVAAALKERLSR